MAIAKVNGLSLGYETLGRGVPGSSRPGGVSPRSPPGCVSWPSPWRPRATACHLGPAQLRRVRRLFRRNLGVGHAGRCARRAARAPRHGAGGHRRWLRWCSRIAAHRLPSPRGRRGLAIWSISGGVFGLLSLAMHYCGGSLRRGLDRGHGGGGSATRLDRGPGAEPRELANGSSLRTVTSSSPPWNAGCWPTAPRRRQPVPGTPARRRPRAGHPDSRLPQRRQRRPPHPCDLGGARRDLAPGAARGAAVGRPRVARTPGIERRGPLRAGPSWPPRQSSGRPKAWVSGPARFSVVELRRIRYPQRVDEEPRQLIDPSSKSQSRKPCTNHISGNR